MEDQRTARERRTAGKREEILAAATEVFFAQGFARTSMDDVLARGGGSKRTLYKYFSSKEELFAALVARVADTILPTLEGETTTDVKEVLLSFGARYLRALLSPDGLALYRAAVSEAPHIPRVAEDFYENGTGRLSRSLARFFQQLEIKSGYKFADSSRAAGNFLALIRGETHFAALLLGVLPSDQEIDVLVAEAVEIFISGISHSFDTTRKPTAGWDK